MTKSKEIINDYIPFSERHIGPSPDEKISMLKSLGYNSMDELMDEAVPPSIRDRGPIGLGKGYSEKAALDELSKIMEENQIFKSYIGMGYYDTHMPAVIQRNIVENPGWYTQYTPYQSEISQGRLEALFNFQTMISDLTGLEVSNASMLDESTSAAEAVNMCYASKAKNLSNLFYVAADCNPQTIEVVKTRGKHLGMEIQVTGIENFDMSKNPFGALVQYPSTDGLIRDYKPLADKLHAIKSMLVCSCDLLSLSILTPPGEFGADVATGSAQRFGFPMAFGGPHAGFFATRDEFKRKMPGRIVGLSKDSRDQPSFRLALATREQHIRREKATSNICTAQVLTAIIATMYAIHHGPSGLKKIALRVNALAGTFAQALRDLGYKVGHDHFFDTVRINLGKNETGSLLAKALSRRINLRKMDEETITVSLDETTSLSDLSDLISLFSKGSVVDPDKWMDRANDTIPETLKRKSAFLSEEVFNKYRSEMKMQRYIKMLEGRDLSLTRSMIPLGSCTMKLNSAAELLPITWPKVSLLHPFVPEEQTKGYKKLFSDLETWLSKITGFSAVSLQPNSGAQGELTGLLVIRKYFEEKGESHRNICLIPHSAHGTNPASAALSGFKIIEVACDGQGNVDKADLARKAEENKYHLAALMITYPSTHGVFEDGIDEICKTIHKNGGQVYMDGANLQAQISLCKAGLFGPDVCHMNLHKTFAMPHGGGGPGIGPIAVAKHLAPYLPTHPVVRVGGEKGIGPTAGAPWGSASFLVIPWLYIRMMGEEGLAEATRTSILSANYVARRLKDHYPVLYTGRSGLVAHECIIDLRDLKKSSGVDENDIAKRLMDYSFHAPTVSFPVPGTMMIEPTESEPKEELDRFCEAMILIREEIREIETGRMPRENNLLKNAPHTASVLAEETWDKPYSRKRAVFPLESLRDFKFWPHSSRIDNAYGDRNLVCRVCM
ncbi:MAG: aminomethyl-transferring glycine dehydrogenase [Oligoflexales bacterium]|nr:aminomethyl-transferring glycine dehydrogenase [Oligoflexales bacterium]